MVRQEKSPAVIKYVKKWKFGRQLAELRPNICLGESNLAGLEIFVILRIFLTDIAKFYKETRYEAMLRLMRDFSNIF